MTETAETAERQSGDRKEETENRPCPLSSDHLPWHFLYFLPDPQGHGSLGMIFLPLLL